MLILKRTILNKIFPKNKQLESYEKKYELSIKENEKLKKENEEYKERETLLKSQNKELFDENNTLLNMNNSIKKENNSLKNNNKRLEKLNTFITFQEFLANSYVSPIINAPFYALDKRIFAFMDHISKYLIKRSEKIKNKPLVSIIMPIYNNENTIQNAINSILKQTYENWELIIINDGSTDNSLDLINNLSNSKFKIISYEENKGLSYARNCGLKKATGKYIMYLNPNNEWDSRYMETMIGAFLELNDANALYSGQLFYKNHNNPPYAVCFGSFNKPLLHNRNYIDINCFCHTKKIYEEMGGFDEELSKLCEWDYILKISNRYKMYSVPVLLSKYYGSYPINNIKDFIEDYYDISADILKMNIVHYKNYKTLSQKVSVIIPNYESLEVLKLCIETILSFNSKDMLDIIIVDNNSSIEVKEYLKKMELEHNIKIILNDINYGFTFAVEQGIKISDENSDILILNNDAILTEGAIEHMQKGAYSYKDCGIIVPHEIVFEENPHMVNHVPYSDPKFKCDITPSKAHHNIINMSLFHDGGLLELNFAPFFCTYIKRDVYNKTLGLDPELGRHYRSDHIFSDFVRHILNMRIYQEPHAYVFHKHQTATNLLIKNKEEYNIMFNKNQWPPELAKKLGFKKALWD